MKLVIGVVLAIAGVVLGNPPSNPLPHFKKSELGAEYRKFNLNLPESCEKEEIENCMKGVHKHAKKCIGLWFSEEGEDILACETENEDIAAADMAWQKASFRYHQAIEKCLAGEPIPASSEEDDDNDAFFLFRRKRDHHGHHSHNHDETYENARACWGAMHGHRTACKAKANLCPAYQKCSGEGDAPADAAELAVFDRVKELYEDKQAKVRVHKTKLHQCLNPDATEEELNQLWSHND